MVFLRAQPQRTLWNGSVITVDWGGKPQPKHLELVSSSLAVERGSSTQQFAPSAPVDWTFVLVYWSLIAIAFIVFVVLSYYRDHKTRKLTRRGSLSKEVLAEPVEDDLPDSTYALPLACALGLVQTPDDQNLPLWVGSILAFSVTFIQAYTVILLYDAIDLSAQPITVKGASPGHIKPFSTNQMKVFMTVFLSIFSTEESVQFLKIWRLTLLVHPYQFESQSNAKTVDSPFDEIPLSPEGPKELKWYDLPIRVWLLLFPVAQFFCLLQASAVGVCALMSEQSGLMVISDAVGICFVSQLDDLMWKFASAAFGLTADLKVKLRKGSRISFEPSTEASIRSSMWFPLALMWFLFIYAMRNNHLPVLPNPLVPLGLSG